MGFVVFVNNVNTQTLGETQSIISYEDSDGNECYQVAYGNKWT